MNNNIAETSQYLEDSGLIYIPEINKAGIHIQGLARLLCCDASLVQRAKRNCCVEDILEAEIHTTRGLRTVAFILENGVIEILEQAIDSPKVKKETRQKAQEIYRKFAKAGFKLYAMLQVAPEKLGMEPKPSPRKSFDSLSRIQLWALFLYRDVETKSYSPDIKMIEGIDPVFWGASVDVLRYAFARKDLAELEWAQPTNDAWYEVFGDRKTLVKDMRQEFDRLRDLRCYVSAMERHGMRKALDDFELAINGALAT